MGLLVSDYDGTFTAREEDIRLNCRALEKYIKNGNYFVLSSGRPLDSLLEQVRRYNIPYTHLGASDGNYLFDHQNNLLQANTMPNNILSELDELMELDIYKGIQYTYSRRNSYTFDPNEELGSIAFVIREENVNQEFLTKYHKLEESHPEYRFDVYGYHGIYFYMVRPIGISKSTPIKFLSSYLSIPPKKIYTIGDNDNDFEMIRDYNGYMIGENESLKKVALRQYNAVHELINDINKRKVKKR